MKKRNILVVILSLIMVFTLAACGPDTSELIESLTRLEESFSGLSDKASETGWDQNEEFADSMGRVGELIETVANQVNEADSYTQEQVDELKANIDGIIGSIERMKVTVSDPYPLG